MFRRNRYSIKALAFSMFIAIRVPKINTYRKNFGIHFAGMVKQFFIYKTKRD